MMLGNTGVGKSEVLKTLVSNISSWTSYDISETRTGSSIVDMYFYKFKQKDKKINVR